MRLIALNDYWMGRDSTHASALTDEIRKNAAETVLRANLLLAEYRQEHPSDEKPIVSSGWRPQALNAKAGGAKGSHHLRGAAIDIADPKGDLDRWCMTPAGQAALERIGLWLEHPSATKTWCHVQIIPPRSGRRVFYP